MIHITTHALDHWVGRCGQYLTTLKDRAQRRELEDIVELGRMATKDEAKVVAMYLNRAKHSNSYAKYALNDVNVVISDEHDVGFVISFDREFPTVVTSVPMWKARRHVRGLNHKKLHV